MENTVVGRCRLLRKLGEGGMGVVWLARHETLQREVAVKVLPESAAKEAEAVERLLREARAAAKLEHPNVIQVLDAGTENGVHFIVMQYVDGTDLEKILSKKGKLAWGEALAIAKKVAQALGAAHGLGLIHRDIKPANVMITKQGRVMVADFGLARDVKRDAGITSAGQVMGTPHYLSPEQARGEELDGRSDLYSLGGSLYTLLTGRHPFSGPTAMAIVVKHASPNEVPEPVRKHVPEIPVEVEALVSKLMAKRREERPASATEVVAAIDKIKGGGATMLRVSEDKVLTPQRRRTLLIRGAGAGLGGLFLLIFLLVLLGPKEAERAWREAQKAATEEAKVIQLREAAARFPNDPWGRKAKEEADAIVRGKFDRELAPLAAGIASGKVPFSEGMTKLDVLRGRFPEFAAAVDRKEHDLHVARVIERAGRLGHVFSAEKKDDQDRIADFIAPSVLRDHGRKAVGDWLRIAIGAGLIFGFRVESIEVVKADLKLQSRKTAEVPVRITTYNKNRNERKTETKPIPWAWIEGEWYLPEPPPK